MTLAAEIDIVQYLATKGHHGRPAHGAEVTYACFFDCQEAPNSKKRKLYVNSAEGMYECKVCGARGGTYLLQKHFGDDPKVSPLPGADPAARRRILEQAADVGMEMLAQRDDILEYLLVDRGLTEDTILERKIGFVGGSWSLAKTLPEEHRNEDLAATGLVYRDGPRKGDDFFYDHILIPYQSHGSVVQIRGKKVGGKYMTGPGENVRLYNIDSLDEAEDVIITEGEFDCMVVAQALALSPEDRVRRFAVVGLAGADALPERFESFFSTVKRAYIALDPDDTGRRASIRIKELLGTRSRVVELPRELPKCDWTEYLLPVPADADDTWRGLHPHAGHDWRDIMSLIGGATGKRVFFMREAGTAHRAAADNQPGMKTGYAGLDGALLPGLKPGQVSVFLAKTGTGKTLLLCNLAYNMRHHKVLFVSLEMTREEVYERLMRIYLFHHPLASTEQLEFALQNVLICDENKLSQRDFEAVLEDYEIETGSPPDLVLLDYLGYYARGQKGSSAYDRVTEAIMQLKALAKSDDPSRRCHIITPAQVNRGVAEGKPITLDDARDAGTIEETADFLLSIFAPDNALNPDNQGYVQPSGKLRVEVLKSRHGNKGRVFSLVVDLLTLAIVDDNTPEAKRAQEHNYLKHRGWTWDDLRKKELEPVQPTLMGRGA